MYRAVFSDVDGTLINSRREVSPRTRDAIIALQARGIPFVIVTGRCPAGVYPIQKRAGFDCPIIAYGGALIRDEKRNTLFSEGFKVSEAVRVIEYLEAERFDLTWCAYCGDDWITPDRRDPRIVNEETVIKAISREGRPESLPLNACVNKILGICAPGTIDNIEVRLKAQFPELSICKSSNILLEIMTGGMNKAVAIKQLCAMWQIPMEDTIAFGDSYNDVEMLEAVGRGVIMANAPADLLNRFPYKTQDNDHDGIALELEKWFPFV